MTPDVDYPWIAVTDRLPTPDEGKECPFYDLRFDSGRESLNAEWFYCDCGDERGPFAFMGDHHVTGVTHWRFHPL